MAEQEHQERGMRIKDMICFIEVTSPIELSQVSKIQDSNQVYNFIPFDPRTPARQRHSPRSSVIFPPHLSTLLVLVL